MVKLAHFDVGDDHPLALELASLRSTLARFQDEAHTTSIKLQRHSLDAARAHDRLGQLERENEVLRKEVAILRAYPHPDGVSDSHPAVAQVRQLTLSLRQLSEKLSLTEEALLARTAQHGQASNEVNKVKYVARDTYESVTRLRGMEQGYKARERELELRIRAAEEQARMTDLVVKEYADLVRSLEGKLTARVSNGSALDLTHKNGTSDLAPRGRLLAESLEEGKFGLQRLVSEFAMESERLHSEIGRLQVELSISQSEMQAEKACCEAIHAELAKVQTELQKLRVDDITAAKMVSRYMKFSQTSANALQTALASLKSRHAATVDTLSTQISSLTAQLHESEGSTERLRAALDELGGDYMKESYGRRREVALRIKLINREEALTESLRRWVLRTQEELGRDQDMRQEILARMVNDAKTLLAAEDGRPPESGSLARIIAAQSAADSLVQELRAESARRLEIERSLAVDNKIAPPNINGYPYRDSSTQYQPTSSSVAVQTPSFQDSPMLSPISPIISLREKNLPAPPSRESEPEGDSALSAVAAPDTQLSTKVESVQQEALLGGSMQHNLSATLPNGYHNNRPDVLQARGTSDETSSPSTTEPPVSVRNELSFHDTSEPHLVENQPQDPDSAVALEPTPEVAPTSYRAGESSISEMAKVYPQDPESMLLSQSDEPPPELTTANGPAHDSGSIPSPKHPLLAELTKVSHRYDALQRSFHDCHFALDSLRKLLTPPLSDSLAIPPDALKIALDRLDDYIEDARVDIEIRIADEGLLAHGYETLLSVPGALASPGSQGLVEVDEEHDSIPLRSDVEMQIEAFVSGTDPNIKKSLESLTNKLADVQHDIAVLKLAVHDQGEEAVGIPSPSLSPGPATAPVANSQGGWTSWIRSSTPRPSSPAPTFGSVMTSPRLRHSPSLNLPAAGRLQKPYFQNGDSRRDPLASLGLKVPMPTYIPQSPAHPAMRSRTVSTMYMLGLGARTASGSVTSLLSPRKTVIDTQREVEVESEMSGDDMSDVE
ncbi:hypothetical protein AMATHDRAFT_149762 [Amanita thiersii Skay4041]|uniref:Uncharacterized protein n=1 Tax=Amanita thiersii Skay4041 TaxID=703135 RepID=A0A2A9NJS2_9AGAR|nr:hypothetical protein AMATHDRAFT_149762 [Amanita thiersii Skay4041]